MSFQITNGVGKRTGSYDYERHSEIKTITENALYRFVDETDNPENAAAYIEESSVNNTKSANTYLLSIENEIIDDDDEPQDPKTNLVHIATVVTDTNGTQKYIKWLRQVPNPAYDPEDPDFDPDTPETIVDPVYLNHTNSDIGPTAGDSHNGVKTVRVIKSGEYFWEESKAPTGYELAPIKPATPEGSTTPDGTTTVSDTKIVGSLRLEKELAPGTPAGTYDSTNFPYFVDLTAPTGKKFVKSGTTLYLRNTDGTGSQTITFKKFDHVDSTTNEDVLVTATPSAVNVPKNSTSGTEGTTARVKINVSKNAYVVIDDIPFGVQYEVSEDEDAIASDNWVEFDDSGLEGTISSVTQMVASITNAKTTGLEISKEVNPSTNTSDFEFTVRFTNLYVSLDDFDYYINYSSTHVTDDSNYPTELVISLKHSESFSITGLPLGTQYQVTETDPGTDWETNYVIDRSVPGAGTEIPSKTVLVTGSEVLFQNDLTEPGSLVLEKTVNGQLPTGMDADTVFKFKVKLTGDLSNIDFDDGVSTPASVTSGQWFDVKLKAGATNKVTILGLPDGVTYEVYEDTAHYYDGTNGATEHDHPTNTGVSVNYYEDAAGHKAAGTISSGTESEVEVTNTYPLAGTLGIYKYLTADDDDPDWIPTGTKTYEFTGLFTRTDSLDLSKYTISGATVGAYDSTLGGWPFTASITISSGYNGHVTVSGIPYGTTYSFSEDARSDGSTVSFAVPSGVNYITIPNTNDSASGTVNADHSAHTVNVTNNYEEVVNFTVGKDVQGNPPAGVPNSDGPEGSGVYTILVTIKPPQGADFSTYPVDADLPLWVVTNGAATNTQLSPSAITGETTFALKLTDGDEVVISGLPVGTQVKAVETAASKADTTGTSGQLVSFNTINVDSNCTIVNKYESGNLKLEKEVAAGSDDTASFSYTVTLDRTGISNDTVDLRDYLVRTTNGGTKINNLSVSSVSQYDSNKIIFTIPVTHGTSKLITNIPFGTPYSVTETAPSDADWVTKSSSGTSGTINSSLTTDGETGKKTADAKFVNVQVGELGLEKAIGNAAAALQNGIDPVVEGNQTYTQFYFDVEITKPTAMDLRTFAVDYLGITDANYTNGVYSPYSYNSQTGKFSRTFTVTSDPSSPFVGINNLPYGTSYKVTEQAPDPDKRTSVVYTVNDVEQATAYAEGSISGDTTVEVKNNYAPLGTLTLRKRLGTGTRPNNTPNANAQYTFLVTFTNPSDSTYGTIDIANYTITQTGGVNNPGTHTVSSGGTIAVTLTAGSSGDVVLSGIPYDVTYTVRETDSTDTSYTNSKIGTTSVAYNGNTSASNASGTIDNSETVTVTNNYPLVRTLKITKDVDPDTLPTGLNGIDADTEYTIHVDLTAPSSPSDIVFNNYPISYTITGDAAVHTPANKTSFDIILKGGQTATIINIPDNTGYNVTETDSTSVSQTSSVEIIDNNTTPISVSGNTVTPGTLDEAESTVTVRNTYYSTGTLVLQKIKEKEGSVYPADLPSSYTFNVTLNAPGGATLLGSGAANNAPGYKIEANTGTSGAWVSVGANASSFTVSVPPGTSSAPGQVIIRGIPAGTTYTVTEANGSMIYTSDVDIDYDDTDSSKDIDNTNTGNSATDDPSSDDVVTITNTYPNTGDLVLKKDVVGSAPTGVTSYSFHVILQAAKDASDSTYIDLDKYDITVGGTAITSYDSANQNISYNTSTHQYVLNVTVPYSTTNNTGVRISGLPYGTKYEVTENSTSGNPSVGGEVELADNKTIGTNMTDIGTAQSPDNVNLVTITNAYSGLVLYKELDGYYADHDVDADTPFTYHVKLTHPTLTLDPDAIIVSGSAAAAQNGAVSDITGSTLDDIVVTVKKGSPASPVSISGMPSGTRFEVYEDTSGLPTGASAQASGAGTGDGTPTSKREGTIGSTGSTDVTITNTYPDAGSLKLIKHASNKPDGVGDASFDVTLWIPKTSNIDMTNQNVTLDGDPISFTTGPVQVDIEGVYYDEYTKTVSVPVTTGTDHGVEIRHLPIGTLYQVTETSPAPLNPSDAADQYSADGSTATVRVDSNSAADSRQTGRETVSDDHSVTITNTYPQTSALRFRKTKSGNTSLYTGTYEITVTLTPPTGMTMANFKANYIGSDISSYTDNTTYLSRTYTVYALASDSTAWSGTITGLPYGTKYTVTESAASKIRTDSVTGEVTANDAEIDGTDDVTIDNHYPTVGSLVLSKATVTGSDATSTYFLYKVVLDSSTAGTGGYDLEQYNYNNTVIVPTSPSGRTFETASPAQSPSYNNAKTQYTFYVKVKEGENVTIGNIPQQTTYTVEEITPLPGTDWTFVSGTDKQWTNNTNSSISWVKAGESNVSGNSAVIGASPVTASFTNAQTGDLSIVKDIPSDPDNLHPGTNKFYVDITLTPPTSGNVTMSLDDFAGYFASGTVVDSDPSTNQFLKDTANGNLHGTFEVTYNSAAASNAGMTLSGLPYGTAYKVEETSASMAKTKSVVYKVNGVTEQTGGNNQTFADGTIGSANAVKVENTYPSLGTLVLKKDIEYGTDSTYFLYEVVLTKESGTSVDFADFASSISSDKGFVNSSGQTISSAPCGTVGGTNNSTYTFYVQVKKGEAVTVSNIPQGTTYAVKEVGTNETGWTTNTANRKWTSADGKTSWVNVSAAPDPSGTIGSAASEAEITNRKTGSLTVSKAVTGGTRPADIPSGGNVSGDAAPYTINVTIGSSGTDPGLTYSDGTKVSHTNNTNSYTVTLLAKAGADDSVTFYGIPYGTSYSVAEAAASQLGTSEVGYAGDTSVEHLTSNSTVAITNTYPNTGSLNLIKQVSGHRPSGASNDYSFHVVLEAPEDATGSTYIELDKYAITVGGVSLAQFATDTNQTISYDSANHRYVFNVTVPYSTTNNTGITISGIPFDTEYTVTENNVGSLIGLNGTPNEPTGRIGEHADDETDPTTVSTAQITNNYGQVGVLKLNKALTGNSANYGAYTGKEYTFKVRLTHADLANYPLTVTNSSSYTEIAAPVSGQWYDINVPAGTEVTVSGMPEDTVYDIYESTALPDGAAVRNGNTAVSSTAPVHGTGIPSTGETVTLTNDYTNCPVGDLSLNKELAPGTDDSDISGNKDQVFVYEVTLTAPTNAQLAPAQYAVTDSSNTVISVSPGSPANGVTDTLTYLIKVSRNDPVTISDLPYGTRFTVTEKTSGNYANTETPYMPDGWHYVTENYGTNTNDGDNIVHIIGAETDTPNVVRNSYTAYNARTGSLVLKKKMAAGTTDTSTNFLYKVVLTAPSGLDLEAYNASDSVITTTRAFRKDPPYEAEYSAANVTPSTYTFYVDVNAHATNGPVTIGNIPEGVSYAVTEEVIPSGFIMVDDTDNTTGTIGTGTETAAISNARKGTLTLNKALLPGSVTGETGTVFGYTVELTAPTDGDNTTVDPEFRYENGVLSVNGNTITTGESITVASGASTTTESGFASVQVSQDKKTATVTLHISNATPRTITGLPYGTGYSVSESLTQAQISDGWITVGDPSYGDQAAVGHENDDPTIDGVTDTASVSNSLVGSLDLTKTVQGGTDRAKDRDFTIRVRLDAPTNGSFAGYTIVWPDGAAAHGTQTDTKKVYDITLTHNGTHDSETDAKSPVSITGIPYGTTYTVTEPDNNGASERFKVNNANPVEDQGSGTISDSNDVEVINSYTTMGQIVLKKKLEGDYASKGVVPYSSDENAPDATVFGFEVRLQTGSTGILAVDLLRALLEDGDEWDVTYGGLTGIIPVALTKTYYVPAGDPDGITIGNLPINTYYTVTETDRPDGCTFTVKHDNNSPTTGYQASGHIARLTDVHTVEITNIYPGTLTLVKELDDPPFNVRDDKEFTFNVTLTNSGVSTFTVLVDSEELTVTSGTAFPVTVSKEHPAVINNIPIGTTYLVTEEASTPEPDSVEVDPDTATAITAAAPSQTVTVTNHYAHIDKMLTVLKQDASTLAGLGDVQFYLLKLNADTDITDETVKAAFASNDIDSVVPEYATKVTGIGETVGELDNVLITNSDAALGEIGVYTVSEPDIVLQNDERYFFYEVSIPAISEGVEYINFVKDNSITADRIITINPYQDSYQVEIVNERRTPSEVDVEKTDTEGNPIPENAKFELWYRDVEIPSTFIFNELFITPTPDIVTTVDSDLTAPEPEAYEPETTPSTYTYEYVEESVPQATDTEWILPRTDNDYIYFRDYNTGDPGLEDQQSFNNGNGAWSQNGKRSWLWTGLATNTHGQSQELDYNNGYKFKAQFTGPGKPWVEYEVWERFVDRFTWSGLTSDTVIWKIQPPDGYTKVRFCLYDDSGQCIRTTDEFTFKLGTIYHKSNWGGDYDVQNHKKCYFNVPVRAEKIWSTYADANNNSSTGRLDKRQSGSVIEQADRYTPTEQKIIFHCNSKVVWHNIHITFYDAGGNIVGQKFPGYLMEPYAYAGNDYRINHYLTYELTIPAEAASFSVNNGISSGIYSFSSERTPLKHIEGRKNYGNYFQIVSSDRDMHSRTVRLEEWTSYPSADSRTATYSTLELNSDYDYIYFEKPSNWNGHVYAYFYGGGDLRKHNRQRACYSVWPGIAPVSTEYVDSTGTYHSDVYSYSYTQSLYNGTNATSITNPETTFMSGTKVIYKFRIPKGERRNYDTVIFNDGLKSQVNGTGTHETGNIKYHPGCIYNASGHEDVHCDSQSTYTYTKRGNGDDYIYIRTTDTANWDDLHIVFYANGNQILQSGKGYVMEYAGKQNDGGTTYTYFRMPIPTNATQFSINNGLDNQRSTGRYDILRLDTVGNNTSTDYTKNRMVFTLSGTTLTRTSPTFTEVEHPGTTTAPTQQDSYIDYPVRGESASPARTDTLYIRDDSGWNIAAGDGKIKFYDSNGSLIRGDGTKGNGTYTLIKSVPDGNSKVWYSADIPENARTFTVSYHSGSSLVTTPGYEIYPYGSGGDHTETGDMYYQTESGGNELALLTGTYTSTTRAVFDYTTRDGTTNGKDDLYLVCTDKNDWQNMTVTFQDAGGNTMTISTGSGDVTSVAPEYLNYIGYNSVAPVDGISTSEPLAAGYWYKVAIPDGAKSFTVTASDGADSHTTVKADIFDRYDAISPYEKDYTLGDMQYRLPDNGTSRPTLLYPVFTEVPPDENGQEYDSTKRVDLDQVSDFSKSDAAKLPNNTATDPTYPDYPVLYQTQNVTGTDKAYTQTAATNNVVREWTDGANPPIRLYFDNSDKQWAAPYVHFAGITTSPGVPMTDEGDGIWSIVINNSYSSATQVTFSNNGSGSITKTLPTDFSTKNYKFIPKHLGKANRIYFAVPDNPAADDSSQKWNNTKFTLTGSPTKPDKVKISQDGNIGGNSLTLTNTSAPKTSYIIYININPDDGYTNVQFYDGGSGHTGTTTSASIATNNYFYLGSSYNVYNNYANTVYGTVANETISAKFEEVTVSGPTPTTYTATYQPEDRYGYIADLNAANGADDNDANNYIYIDTTGAGTSITTPYVKFFTNENGTGTLIGAVVTAVNGTATGNTNAAAGIKADLVSGNIYRVRLPRGAKSFSVSGSPEGTYGTVQSLCEDDLTTTITSGAETQTVTIPYKYHHAGTTFYITSNGSVDANKDNGGYTDGKKLREGFTATRTPTLEDPLYPRTDSDFIFFTDTSGSFDYNNSGKVYAYFYGAEDGEFKAWPGSEASKTSEAPTTYTDNNGKTVYMFRVPQGTNGKYSKVIFTNGQTTSANIRITRAADLEAGKNYVLGGVAQTEDTTPVNIPYGAFAPAGKVFDVTPEAKANDTTKTYENGGGRYIYIINNGTKNLGTGLTGRYILDEMHVAFFDQDQQLIGTAISGYIPDLLTGYTDDSVSPAVQVLATSDGTSTGKQIYRILVPANAKYFQINNGVNKGMTGVEGVQTDTQLRERFSVIEEITPNGLYQFVETADSDAGYLKAGETVPADESERHIPQYLLKLVNEIPTDITIPEPVVTEVRLAVVATGNEDTDDPSGMIRYIEWLKPEDDDTGEPPTTVDRDYLDHVIGDVYPASYTTAVRVVKTGTYYWKEIAAPAGYKTNPDYLKFEVRDDGSVYFYDENNLLVKADSEHKLRFEDEPEDESEGGNIVLTKIAKDATTQAQAGDPLGAGYAFMLYQVDENGDAQLVEHIIKTNGPGSVYKYSASAAGTCNLKSAQLFKTSYNSYTIGDDIQEQEDDTNKIISPKWIKPLLTDSDSKLRVENLPLGNYYLEEVAVPDGSLYSPDHNDGWIEDTEGNVFYKERIDNSKYYDQVHNRVYFVIGENNLEADQELVCKDELAPAYIRLFEHIDERRAEWGDPTFIFRIKQTHTYSDTDNDPTTAVYTQTDDGKEYIVALTVDDNGKMTVDRFGEVFNNWYVETTAKTAAAAIDGGTITGNDDTRYANEKLFGLNADGMLPVEPGKYTISRINPSRYEFVANYWHYATSRNAPFHVATYDSESGSYINDNSKYRMYYGRTDEPYASFPQKDLVMYPGVYSSPDHSESETLTELTVHPYRVLDIHYYDKVSYYDKFTQVDTEINKFYHTENNAVTTVKGIRVELRGKIRLPESGSTASEFMTATANDEALDRFSTTDSVLNAYFINVDGTERAMTAEEKEKLVLSFLTDDEEETFDEDFGYDSSTHTLTIENAESYANHVYRLTAVYDEKFSSVFDIAIAAADEEVPEP